MEDNKGTVWMKAERREGVGEGGTQQEPRPQRLRASFAAWIMTAATLTALGAAAATGWRGCPKKGCAWESAGWIYRERRDHSPESLRPHGASPECRDGLSNQVPLNSLFTLLLLPGCHPPGKRVRGDFTQSLGAGHRHSVLAWPTFSPTCLFWKPSQCWASQARAEEDGGGPEPSRPDPPCWGQAEASVFSPWEDRETFWFSVQKWTWSALVSASFILQSSSLSGCEPAVGKWSCDTGLYAPESVLTNSAFPRCWLCRSAPSGPFPSRLPNASWYPHPPSSLSPNLPPLRSTVASNTSLGPKVTDTFHQPLKRELGIPSQLCIEKHPRDPWLSPNSSLRLS